MALSPESLISYLHQRQGLDPSELTEDALLFSNGLLDSFSMVDLLMFVEKEGNLAVGAADVTLDNFDSIGRILAYARARTPES